METNLSTVSNSYIEYAKGCIEKFFNTNNRLPQKKEIQNEVSVDYLVSTYGSWNNTLLQLGFKEKIVSKEEIINSLKALRDTLGTIPSMTNIKEANIDIKPLFMKIEGDKESEYNYGSWNEVKKLLKEDFVTLKPKKSSKRVITAEQFEENKLELGNCIINLTKSLRKVPTVNDLKNENIAISKVIKYFGSWKNAKLELGLVEVEKEIIIDEIKESQKATTSKLSSKDLNDIEISYGKIKQLFGSWKNAYEEIGLDEVRKESVKERVIDLTNTLQKTPTCKEIRNAKIPLMFITRETPWKDIKNEWGLDKISNSYTINEIINLSNKIDYTPTLKELRENNIKTRKLFKQNGGWNKVREMIGLPKHSRYTNTYISEMETKLLDLAQEIGKTPSYSLAKERGIVVNALKSRYGSWNSVLLGVGLRLNSKYTDEAIDLLTQNIKDLADMLGRTPTMKDLKEHKIAINPLRRKYGSLEVCLDAIGLTPNVQTNKTYSKEKVLGAIKFLANKIGKIPSAKRSKEEGIKVNRLIKEVGSWKKVKEILSNSILEDGAELQTAI